MDTKESENLEKLDVEPAKEEEEIKYTWYQKIFMHIVGNISLEVIGIILLLPFTLLFKWLYGLFF